MTSRRSLGRGDPVVLGKIDVRTELYIGTAWTDITNDVYTRDDITISRGRRSESADVDPTQVDLTLNNRSGNYSPRNPLGAWYGMLGRNTPLRISLRTVVDAFGDNVTAGWGTTDTGSHTWSLEGLGGTVQNSDWNVTGGKGTHSVPATSAFRASYLPTVSYRDIEVAATVTPSVANVTGGDLEPCNLIVRRTSSTVYYMVRLVITSTESVTITWYYSDNTPLVAPVTVPITYSGQALRVRAQVEGYTLRAKVWDPSTGEPYDWSVVVDDNLITTAGAVGIRSGVASGVTNPLPIVYSYDDFEVRSPRAAVEVSRWPQRWDVSGKDKHVPLEASGILRRLGQGAARLQSALRRSIPSAANLVAYWPCEDGENSTLFASAIMDTPPMHFYEGEIDLASFSGFVASEPLPQPKSSRWYGPVQPYTSTGTIQLRHLLHIPDSGTVDGAIVSQMYTTGSAVRWEVHYAAASGGSLALYAYDIGNTQLVAGTAITGLNGRLLKVSVELDESGGGVNWALRTLEVGAASTTAQTGTLGSNTCGAATDVGMSVGGVMQDVAMGHITVQSDITPLSSEADELAGYAGETARARMERLCLEENVPWTFIGDFGVTALMGPQTAATLLDLLSECAEADRGTLYETRGTLGLVYKALGVLTNQTTTLALDYSKKQLSPPFEPDDDDFALANDVTAKRVNGSEARSIQETGPLSVADPADGGVGRYDTTVTVNVQLDDQLPHVASWVRHLGTVDEARYPTIRINRATPAVAANPALLAALLDVTVDDRLTIDNPPAGQPPDQITQLVRGYTEQIGAHARTHTLSLNCAPASPYEVIELDDSGVSRYDSDTTTLVSGISSGATNFTARIDDNTVWTEDDTQFPFDIMVGGERMTVTDITSTAPSFVAAGTAAHADNASVTPGLPAGVTTGDAMLVFAAARTTTATVSVSGYTLLADLGHIRLYGKIHSGSESAPTVTVSGGAAGNTVSAQMCAFRSLASLSVITTDNFSNASAQDIAYPKIGKTVPKGIVLWLGWKQDDWTSVSTISGATEIGEPSSTLGNDQGLAWDYQLVSGNIPVAPGSFAVTGGAAAISKSIVLMLGNWQVFSVTRSVNGVVKAQTAGTSVHLARQAAWALSQ